MKKILSMLIAVVMVVSIIAVPVAAAPNTKKLVVLGDSISTGYGLDGYEKNDGYSAKDSYANKLAKEAKLKAGTTYQNFAVDGDTTLDLLAKVEDEDVADAIADANTIIISIGGNDFLKEFVTIISKALSDQAAMLQLMGITVDVSSYEKTLTTLTEVLKKDTSGMVVKMLESTLSAPSSSSTLTGIAQVCAENIAKIIAKIKTQNETVNIYVQDVYNPFSGITDLVALSDFADTIIGKSNELVLAETENSGYKVIKTNDLFRDKAPELTNMSTFDIHPNVKGHDALYQAISKQLPQVGLVVKSGKTYYYDTNSKMVKSKIVEISKAKYYFDSKGVMATSKIVKVASKSYYFDKNGKAVTGLQTINKVKYYFDKNGVMATSKIVKVASKSYYFDKNGKAVTGLQTINKAKYYFDKNGVMATSKTMTVGKIKYTFDKNGKGKVVK